MSTSPPGIGRHLAFFLLDPEAILTRTPRTGRLDLAGKLAFRSLSPASKPLNLHAHNRLTANPCGRSLPGIRVQPRMCIISASRAHSLVQFGLQQEHHHYIPLKKPPITIIFLILLKFCSH
jgi:hypothetical protein